MNHQPPVAALIAATVVGIGCTPNAANSPPALPPPDSNAVDRLNSSPRHGEWATIPKTVGADSVRLWVVYPERSDRAPVVLVIHEIFGLTPWVRAVADQLAADGFVAIAPDLMTSKDLPGSAAEGPARQAATAAIRTLDPAEVQRDLDAAARYGMSLPAATQSYGIVGFCWGGTTAFLHALHSPGVGAAVVYYGSTPGIAGFEAVRAPILGLYGENDSRVTATIPAATSGMAAAGKRYESHVFPGAGHGFVRAQGDAANAAATERAWPLSVAFLRRHLER
jgi:carboxymethylenebutenolidase